MRFSYAEAMTQATYYAPLAQAAEAFERMNSGQARYRMVLTV